MDKKVHCMNLPDIRFVDPNVQMNNELCFSISLFESHFYSGMDDRYFDIYNQVFTRPALWTAMSFLWNSDLGENGIKVFFHVEDNVYDIVYPYLRECGVPDKYIRKIILPDNYQYDEEVNHTQFGKKFMCFYDDELGVNSVNIIDSDMFLCTRNDKQSLYRDLTCPVVRNNISIHEYKFVRYNFCYYMQKVVYAAGASKKFFDSTGWVNEGFNMFESKNMLNPVEIERYCFDKYKLEYKIGENIPASDYVVRPFVSANLCQIPLDHDFVSFFLEYGHQCYHEEGLLGMYFLAKGITPIRLDQVLGIPRYLHEDEYSETAQAYLAHYIDKEQNPDSRCYADFYRSMLDVISNANR